MDEDKALEASLLDDEKERCEHIMLVDLGRNDVGKARLAALCTWNWHSHAFRSLLGGIGFSVSGSRFRAQGLNSLSKIDRVAGRLQSSGEPQNVPGFMFLHLLCELPAHEGISPTLDFAQCTKCTPPCW